MGKSVSFNVHMDPEMHAHLREVARREGKSMGQVVCEAINARAWHVLQDRPHCATGNSCLCPHFHIKAPPIQSTETPPPTKYGTQSKPLPAA